MVKARCWVTFVYTVHCSSLRMNLCYFSFAFVFYLYLAGSNTSFISPFCLKFLGGSGDAVDRPSASSSGSSSAE